MQITLLQVGKTDNDALIAACNDYFKRINHYIKFEINTLPGIKNIKTLSFQEQKIKEGEQIIKILNKADFIILLDENGKEYSSIEFSAFINKQMVAGRKHIIFCIGGPYGFSDEVYAKANEKIALSRLTFPHQLVRVIFLEQLYRAFSIINKEPYHHQ